MRIFMTALFCFALLDAAAFNWELPSRAWTKRTPPGPWSLLARDRKSGTFTVLSQQDYNPQPDRLMFSEPNGNVWSRPSVHLLRFNEPGEQEFLLLSSPLAEPVVAFDCIEGGRYRYRLKVSDPNPSPAGTDYNAMFVVELLDRDGKTKEQFREFSWRGKANAAFSGEFTASPGDRLVFRKTFKGDDFNNSQCRVEVGVSSLAFEPGRIRAFTVGSDRITLADYFELPSVEQDGKRFFNQEGKPPLAAVSPGPTANRVDFSVRAEKDSTSPHGAGDIALVYPVGADGNYKLTLHIVNRGLDVKGGDGGTLRLSVLPEDADVDVSHLFQYKIPPSKAGKAHPETAELKLKLRKNALILFRFNAGTDGYADEFLVNFRLDPLMEEAPEPPAPSAEQILPRLDLPRREAGAPIRPGFWVGGNMIWFGQSNMMESMALLRKYCGDLSIVMVGNRPDLYPALDYFRKNNIPTLTQHFGRGYEPFFRYRGAFEWDSSGFCTAEPLPTRYNTGNAHCVAHPHPAFRQAYGQLGRAGIRSGYSGYGYHDLVWYWGSGAGESGFSPATIDAFRQDLSGDDEGFTAAFHGKERLWRFADYAAFYLGGMPKPRDFNLSSWRQYRPLSRQERTKDNTRDVTAELLLHDLLVHYEYLKSADRIGREVAAEGGSFQAMPNPEDTGNGTDSLFLAALTRVPIVSEEYFRANLTMAAVYTRLGYFRRRNAGHGGNYGVVMETGNGGNANPYYDSSDALRCAYEIMLAGGVDHFEADFWPSSGMNVKAAADHAESNRRRYAGILAFGLGHKYAVEDRAFQPLPPDFVSATSRGIFRPWGMKWHPWSWYLNTVQSPDRLLFRSGYVFAGCGDEALANRLYPETGTLIYSASPPTAASWRALKTLLERGEIKRAVVPVAALANGYIAENFKHRPFSELEPSWKFEPVRSEKVDGLFRVSVPGAVPAAALPDGESSVVRVPAGKGELYLVCFAVAPPESNAKEPNRELARRTFGELLNQFGITPHWKSEDPLEVRLYRNRNGAYIAAAFRTDAPYPANERNRYPDTVATEAKFRLKLPPGAYRAISFPELADERLEAKDDGFFELRTGKRVYSIWHIVPEGEFEALRRKLAGRAEEFRKAMTLDGRIDRPIR